MWPICSQLAHWAYNQGRNACSSCGERTVCGRLLVSGIVFFDIPASPSKPPDTPIHYLLNLHSARTPVYGTRIRDPKTGPEDGRRRAVWVSKAVYSSVSSFNQSPRGPRRGHWGATSVYAC